MTRQRGTGLLGHEGSGYRSERRQRTQGTSFYCQGVPPWATRLKRSGASALLILPCFGPSGKVNGLQLGRIMWPEALELQEVDGHQPSIDPRQQRQARRHDAAAHGTARRQRRGKGPKATRRAGPGGRSRGRAILAAQEALDLRRQAAEDQGVQQQQEPRDQQGAQAVAPKQRRGGGPQHRAAQQRL